MLARVSHLEAFRQWRQREDQSLDDLIRWLTVDDPTPAMLAGTAFHAALETAPDGDHPTLHANGHTFQMPDDSALVLPKIRELREFKQYGPLTVTGCVDCLFGKRIDDHKTTSRFDPERYLDGYQWRLYLDIFDADIFRWNVFELSEVRPLVFDVAEPQTLTQYRYPGMADDCARLAAEFYEFARVYLPGFNALKEAA